jgi:hypothetical protein
MNNKTFLAIAFLLAGTLLTAATTAMAPAYAGGDDYGDGKDDYGDGKDSKSGDGIKQRVEDHSVGNIADCNQYWIGKEFEDTEFQNEQIQECIASATREGDINNDGNGGEEPNGPPVAEPETCEECFERFLSAGEIADLVAVLDEANQAESLVDFCENVLEPGFITEGEVRDFLTSAEVDEEIHDDLIECLEAVGIVFEPEM